MSRIDGPYDAVLHLLDRQILDAEGRMVGKVDDLALSAGLRVTHLLLGGAVLVPRLAGRSGARAHRFWDDLGEQYADRTVPYTVPMSLVADVGSAVTLDRPRDDLLEKHPVEHRLGDLLRLPVRTTGGRDLGRVLDVRLSSTGDVTGLVVGRGGPGSLLGYDRRRDQGPWLLGALIRWLHRHSGYVERRDVDRIDWGSEIVVTVDSLGEVVDVDE